jgi:cytochrome d ubiquinol oxidase subunit I
VLTNPWLIRAFAHTIAAALLTGAMLVLAVAAWQLRHGSRLFAPVVRVALWSSLAAGIATILIGHEQAQYMTRVQPMKMAAAEALYNTERGANFSLFDIGPWSEHPSKSLVSIHLPHLLSVLADNSWNGTVQGINQIQAQEVARYGPGDYRPIIGITYWSFRVMAGLAMVALAISIAGLWLARVPDRLESTSWFLRIATWSVAIPLAANLAGWVFTEMGRQPWVVQGLLLTKNAVSPTVGAWSVGLSLGGFAVLYGILAVVEGFLMIRQAKAGPEGEGLLPVTDDGGRPDSLPVLVY